MRRYMNEDGQELEPVTFADAEMNEVEEEDAHFIIVRRPDGELEAITLDRFPTVH